MMKKRSDFLAPGAIWTALLVAFDQWTKYLARTRLAGTSGISLIPGVFELAYLENRGAAFGIFANRQIFFVAIAALMAVFAIVLYTKLPGEPHYHFLRVICVLIASGAIGNMLDRLIFHYVTDFLYVSLIDFPIFNVADCYVCIGAFLTILAMFTVYRNENFEFLFSGKNGQGEA